MEQKFSSKELDRAKIIAAVVDKKLGVAEAAKSMRITPRQVNRLVKRYKEHGNKGLINKAKGKPPCNKIPDSVRKRIIWLATNEFDNFGPTFLSEVLAELDDPIKVSSETVRNILQQAGLYKSKTSKPRHRRKRERKENFGTLVQIDASEHNWFGPNYPKCFINGMIDDATNIVYLRFYETDSTATNMDLIMRYIMRYGRPLTIYADRASHFFVNREVKDKKVTSLTESDLSHKDKSKTQIYRALEELGIHLSSAYSPQAKGRIERLWGTLQDRLQKRLEKIERITTVEEANKFLDRVYMNKFNNSRFTNKPYSPEDMHRPIKGFDLKAIFSRQILRVVANDYTIRLNCVKYQIEDGNYMNNLKGNQVLIEQRLDGSFHFRFNGKYLHVHRV